MKNNLNNNLNDNPFEILNVKPSADKSVILRQVTMAMKNREYDPKSILESQKILFNPVTKAVVEFQYFLTQTIDDKSTGYKSSGNKSVEQTQKVTKTKADYKRTIPPLLNLNNEKTTA